MMSTIVINKDDKNYKRLIKIFPSSWLIFCLIVMELFFLVIFGFFYFITIPEYKLFLSEYAHVEVGIVILNGFNKVNLMLVVINFAFVFFGIFSILLIKNIERFTVKIDNL